MVLITHDWLRFTLAAAAAAGVASTVADAVASISKATSVHFILRRVAWALAWCVFMRPCIPQPVPWQKKGVERERALCRLKHTACLRGRDRESDVGK